MARTMCGPSPVPDRETTVLKPQILGRIGTLVASPAQPSLSSVLIRNDIPRLSTLDKG